MTYKLKNNISNYIFFCKMDIIYKYIYIYISKKRQTLILYLFKIFYL